MVEHAPKVLATAEYNHHQSIHEYGTPLWTTTAPVTELAKATFTARESGSCMTGELVSI